MRVYHCQLRLCVRESSRAMHSWWADAGSQSQLLGKSETADGHLFQVLPWGSNRGQERRRFRNRRRGIILTPVLWNINVCRKGYRLMHLCACASMTCVGNSHETNTIAVILLQTAHTGNFHIESKDHRRVKSRQINRRKVNSRCKLQGKIIYLIRLSRCLAASVAGNEQSIMSSYWNSLSLSYKKRWDSSPTCWKRAFVHQQITSAQGCATCRKMQR